MSRSLVASSVLEKPMMLFLSYLRALSLTNEYYLNQQHGSTSKLLYCGVMFAETLAGQAVLASRSCRDVLSDRHVSGGGERLLQCSRGIQ